MYALGCFNFLFVVVVLKQLETNYTALFKEFTDVQP